MSKALIAACLFIAGIALSLCLDSPVPGLILVPVALGFVFNGLGLSEWFKDRLAAAAELRKQMKNSKH